MFDLVTAPGSISAADNHVVPALYTFDLERDGLDFVIGIEKLNDLNESCEPLVPVGIATSSGCSGDA
jgi:hypothetical protein